MRWHTSTGRTSEPLKRAEEKPHVMGHLYHFVPVSNRYGSTPFYELHVWAWKNNPYWSFTDWNPRATCAEWGGTSALSS
jgi:hypothetical protein